ncbi:hypothetical protein A3E46_02660 [Candidatus Woesebacteria bacterium RIFCSPHIGHO2_12_FULL_46_16]|uniref:Uncharacterized protein n=1 Tax=Candidatus Woesebacteria bacterium RIFCSPHIGHO2_12_FULL_46_16 TaxID=1802513 RepID=A0A1F8AZM0_9BACT|nr:MAG: hypothetical protein A3E46_02660 [Candidatus Woesebacteria bacterium RIFCSPHIGHO2_12_FULL_46_16]
MQETHPTQPVQPLQQVQQAVQPVVKKFPKFNLKGNLPLVLGVVLVILAGVGTGWLLSGRGGGSGGQTVPGAQSGPKEAGLADESTFKDSAEGVLEEGGVDGEGTHHLVRSGGASQNVYLTSTVIDLQSFVGKKVMVWGQTIAAQQAGWLMDVGKIKVTE